MKTKNYFWAVLATVTLSLAACSSEENDVIGTQEMNAMLKLTLESTQANTKATGSLLPTSASENKINMFTLAIFNNDGSVSTIQEATLSGSSSTVDVNCYPGTGCTGIVVANVPSTLFSDVTTKSAFIAKTVDLTQTPTALPMSGIIETTNGQTTFNLTAGSIANLAVSLSRLTARIAFTSIKTGFEAGQYANATFTAKKIFLHNANSKSTVNPDTPAGSVPISGKLDGVNTDLQDALNQSITTTPYTTPHWFYTFEHDANYPTKIVIFGTFDPDGSGPGAAEDLYYPVVVNKEQIGTTISSAGDGTSTILHNYTYNIKATIKGKGVADPDIDISPVEMSLKVSVNSWDGNVNQDVTFN